MFIKHFFILVLSMFVTVAICKELPMTKLDLSDYKDAVEQHYSPLLESNTEGYTAHIDLFTYMTHKQINGSYIYEIVLADTTAFALSLFFSSFEIPHTAVLLIETDNEQRKYSQTKSNTLAVLPFIGSEITISIVDSSAFKPTLILGGFSVIPEDDHSLQFARRLKSSGACNIDLECSEGNGWREIGNAVCKMQVGNSRLNCTGTLVNNTARNARPMILTANHCIPDSLSAVNSIFIFNYKNDSCNGEREDFFTLSGAKLLATSKDKSLDFALVELWDPLPEEANVHFAGWDLSTDQFSKSTVIHHPRGDVKKISASIEAPTVDWFIDSRLPYELVPNSHWLISEWEYGVTEGGSSGASLLNAEMKIIGTLIGGDAYCGNPYDDFFQMISYSWDHFSDSTQQLKYWLDPLGLGVRTFEGTGPSSNCVSATDNLINLKHPDCSDSYLFGTSCTGDSEFGFKTYAEKRFMSGFGFYVGDNDVASTDSVYVNIYEYGDKHKHKQLIYRLALPNSSMTNQAFNSFVLPKGLELPDEYFFSIHVPETVQGDFSVLLNNSADNDSIFQTKVGNEWLSFQDLGMKVQLPVCIYTTDIAYDTKLKSIQIMASEVLDELYNETYTADSMYVYPNPVTDGVFTIALRGVISEMSACKIYDLQGKLWLDYTRDLYTDGNLLQVNVRDLPGGIYNLYIETDEDIVNRKIVITNSQ